MEKTIEEKDLKIKKIEEDAKKFEEEYFINKIIIESNNQELVEKECQISALTMSIADLKSELTAINAHESDEATCMQNDEQKNRDY